MRLFGGNPLFISVRVHSADCRAEPVQAGQVEHEEISSCVFLCNNWDFMDKSAFTFIDMLELPVRKLSKAG